MNKMITFNLQLGNILNLLSEGPIRIPQHTEFQVIEIEPYHISLMLGEALNPHNGNNSFKADIADVVGVPITEKYLIERMGFYRGHVKGYDRPVFGHPECINLKLLNTSVLEGGFRLVAGFPESGRNIFIGYTEPMQYVHEIQNLFQLSTGGKRLKITPFKQ